MGKQAPVAYRATGAFFMDAGVVEEKTRVA